MTTTEQNPNDGSIESAVISILDVPGDDNQPETAEAEAEAPAEQPEAEVEDVEEVDAADAEAEEIGEEDEQTAEAGDGDEEPGETFRVKVDGEEVEVTLDDLKRSYSGQGYIQKRMKEVAEAKKQAEQVYGALQAEREQMAQQLAQYQQQLGAGEPQKPNRELLDKDPIAYFEQMESYREAVEQREQLTQQQQQLFEQQRQAEAQARQAYLAEQAQLLQQAIPEFSDAEKAGKLKQELVEVGREYGFDPQELTAIADHRHVRVLHDAMRYRKATANKEVAEKKASKARPMVKPGAKRKDTDGRKKRQQQVRSRMKKTGSVEDVTQYLLSGD